MGKRKYEKESDESGKKAKTNDTVEEETGEVKEQTTEQENVSKQHASKSFDVKYFRKELAAKQGQTMVLTQFLQVCLNPDSDGDYLMEYLKCGGNSHEILRQINQDNKKNLTLATPAFHLFHLIILKVQSSVPHMIAITEEACRYFLNNFMSTVEIMISENSGPRHRKIVLKLLTSMVTLNPDLGIEVLNQAPLTPKHLKHIVENVNYKEQDNVRTSFVLFITSFLVDGHLPLIKALLEKQGLLGLVIPGLVQDDAKSVLMFLTILRKNVVDNTFISKSLKLKTFSQQDLYNLFKLFTWKGPPDLDNETRRELQPEITNLLSEILLILFTNHKTGLYFLDNSLGTTDTHKNPNLYRALLSLKRPWQNETESNLILDIVHKCPDLHRAIMNVIEQSFEPQHSPIWEKTVDFTIKLLNKFKPEYVGQKVQNLNETQIVNLVRFITLPVPLLKYIQTNLGKDQTISLYCVKVLAKMLQTLHRYMQILETSNIAAYNELKNKLENFFPKHVPSPAVVVQLIQDIIDKKGDKTEDKTSQDYKLPKINDTDALILLLDLLLLYNDIQPAYFETLEGSIEMKSLLEYAVSLTDDNISILKFKVVSLWLIMDSSVISLKKNMFKQLLLIMLDVYMSDDGNTWIEAKSTLNSFFKNTAIFETDEDEIHLMLYTLRAAKVHSATLISDIVEYVLENLQELSDTVRSQIVNFEISDQNNALSLEKLFDDLSENRKSHDSVFLENKVPSPFIMGCMQYLTVNKDKKKGLKHFLSLYVANLMHTNYSPELTEILIGDSKLEARSYVASWTGQPLALPESITGADRIILNISNSLLDATNLTITNIFDFVTETSSDDQDFTIDNVPLKIDSNRYIDSSELLIWAKYLIFCTVRLTDIDQLQEEQMKKIANYFELIIAVTKHKHMIDLYRKIILNLLKNPHILKVYKPVDFKKNNSSILATKFILNIISQHTDVVEYLDKKHNLLKSYKQKNHDELVKVFVKINKRKNIESEHTMKIIEIVGMSVDDDLRIFHHIFGVEPANCAKDDKEPSIALELLTVLINKYSKSVNLEMQAQILRKCLKLYTELLTNKEVALNLTTLETFLAQYFENKPYQAKNVSDDIFRKFFETNYIRKTTSYLASVILQHNVKLCSIFKEQVAKPEILSQREITLPLGTSVINHKQFLLENKELITTIYNEYKSNINKLLEKPHKAGQLYITCYKFVSKLILECMELQECEKLFTKSHKFESIELNHLNLYQIVFYKLFAADKVKKDHLINYMLSMLHIMTIALKEAKEIQVLREIITNMYTVIQLSKACSFDIEKKGGFKRIIESGVWQSFCKVILKDSLKVKTKTIDQEQAIGPQLLCLLTNLVKLLYEEDHEDISTLFDMVTSHSEFLNVMLSHHSSDIKSRLLEFLYTLILRSKSVMKTQQIPVYLSSYHATRSPCDRLILAILYYYESSGLPVNEYKPYVWGDSGANHYAVRKNRTSTLWGHPTPNHILNLFDREIMERTVRNFPVTQKLDYHYEMPSNINGLNVDSVNNILDNMSRDGVLKQAVFKDTESSVRNVVAKGKYKEAMQVLKGGDMVSSSHVELYEEIYDPVFVLPLLGHVLAPGSSASCVKVLRTGVLSLPVAALGAHCPRLRAAAYHVLHRFCMLLDMETRHKNDKLFLSDFISTLRHSLSSAINNSDVDSSDEVANMRNPRIPSVDALYLARALTVCTAPSHPLYKPVNNFLIAKQFVDLTVVPDFLSLFHDSDLEASERRYWILDVIKDGVKTITDVNVIFKTMAIKMIMDYYSSVLSEKKSKEKILGVLSSLVAVPRALEIMVEGYGLISWIHSVAKQTGKERNLVLELLTLVKNILRSMKINALAKNVASKTRSGNSNDFIELKVNKDVENEILFIVYDLSRHLDVLEDEVVEYLKIYRLLTKRAVKSLSRNEMIALVNGFSDLCKDKVEVLSILRKSLAGNDSIMLKSSILINETDARINELSNIVQVYIS